MLLALLVLVIVLARRTRWRHARSDQPDRTRRAGQIVTAAFGWVRRHLVAVLGISAVIAAVLVGSSLVRTLLLAPRPSSDITDVGGVSGRWLSQFALVVVALTGVVVAAWVAASVLSLVRDDAEGQRPSALTALRVGWAQRPAMVTAVVLLGTTLLLTGSVVLLPVAAFLVARWAVAPAAAVVEDLPVRAALRRSAELTSGYRWRALLVQALLAFVGLSLAGLVGALLLIVTSWPFWVTGLISIGLLAVLLPVAFAGMSLQFYDLRRRHGHAVAAARDGTRPAPVT